MASAAPEIRALLAPLEGAKLLVPSSVVAEVIEYTKPAPYPHGPAWLMGELEWNGWQVPIISLAMLSGASNQDPATSAGRILIVKTLSESASIYYVGILISALPRLMTLGPDQVESCVADSTPPAVFARVRLGESEALVLELDELTTTVEQAVFDRHDA